MNRGLEMNSFQAEQSARDIANGLTPPPPPSNWLVFKVMFSKHVHVARKRRRLLTSVWPALMYTGISVGLYYAFESIDEPMVRATLFAIVVPIYLTLAVQGALSCAIVEIVSEKESKMKIVQQIYGLSPFLYWTSWGAYFLLVSALCVLVIYLLLTVAAPVLQSSTPLLVLPMLLAAYVQQLEFAAIIAVFFDKKQTASTTAGFVSLAMIMIAASVQGFLRGKSKGLFYLAGLLPTVNVFNGFASLFWLEALYYCNDDECTQGLRFSSLMADRLCPVPYSPPLQQCPASVEIYSAGESIALMLVDVILYAILAWWLDEVWQSEYGTAKPLLFCFDPAFLCPRRNQTVDPSLEALEQGLRPYSGTRSVNAGRPLALSIRKMRKEFKAKVAVDDLDLDVYGSEIFALLGHNGAGKTTCMNCVVGLLPMTSGEVSVNGFSVRCDIENVRRQLSICPQDNPLYDVFTVRQHLLFFASLRGVSQDRVSARISQVLSALGMPEKVDELCTTLSGGQKRRLWVATALVGETPVVFLDEPTSGMDPSSRRELWNLLLEMKATGRAVLFTTHYLEEADVLADRKAVLARGRVQACGTSRDLKLQFGLGYHLQVDFGAAATSDQMRGLSELVHRFVDGVVEKSSSTEAGTTAEVGAPVVRSIKVNFTLPFAQVSKFGPLLLEIDANRSNYLISDYSISMTSLEEVFMALGEQAEREAAANGTTNENVDFRSIEADNQAVTSLELSQRNAVRALMRIRFCQLLGNKRAVYSVIVLPAIFNILAFALRNNGSSATQDGGDFNLAFYPPAAFGISIVAFTLQIITDKEWKCKYVAMAQGLSVSAYWGGSLLAHYCISLLNSFILVGAIVVTKPPVLSGNGFLLIVAEAVVYPVGILLLAYNISLLFKSAELAVKVLPLSNLFLATIPTVCVNVFLQLPGRWPDIARTLHVVMSVINPVYALPGVIVTMASEPEKSPMEYFTSWSAIPLYCSALNVLLFGGHLLWQDARSYTSRPGNFKYFGNERKDEDVLAEEAYLARTASVTGEAARYQELSHTYKTKVGWEWRETHAVRGISLGIRSGECFGLLGPNGAGKTTTLAVLTGEVRPPTAGKVLIHGHDLTSSSGLMEAYKVLGVCPQVDPLWDVISGEEHIMFYGRIKGVPEESLKQVTRTLLYRLGFDDADAKKMASTYSGGMKRKLSLAIALIGRSPLLFLDEPSAAVDAGAKRHLWKVIKMRGPEQTVVLTTHSMEEAEALCDRIAIQVKGQLRCLGTPSHIKSKYGSGYQLEIFCQPNDGRSFSGEGSVQTERLVSFVHSQLSSKATLLEQHAGRLLFQLPPISQDSLSLGKVFSEVQCNMEALGIMDYSLTQPSLEQVFVRFAREQDEVEEEAETAEPEAVGAMSSALLAPFSQHVTPVESQPLARSQV